MTNMNTENTDRKTHGNAAHRYINVSDISYIFRDEGMWLFRWKLSGDYACLAFPLLICELHCSNADIMVENNKLFL